MLIPAWRQEYESLPEAVPVRERGRRHEPAVSATLHAMPRSLQAFSVIFLAGAVCRWLGILTRAHADRLATFVFSVSLPATILVSLDRIEFEPTAWKLPLAAWLITLSMNAVAWRIVRWLALPRPTQGGFLLGAGCINSVYFAYPVVLATLGPAALAQAILFDLGQTTITLTVLYGLAVWYGERSAHPRAIAARLLASPPLWALATILTVKLAGIHLPPWLLDLLTPLHMTTTPLASLVLGLSITFEAVRRTLPLAALGVLLRMGGGLVLGIAATVLLDLTDIARVVVILVAGMPSAVTAVIFAADTGLDEDLVASIVALSICLGVALLPWIPAWATVLGH